MCGISNEKYLCQACHKNLPRLPSKHCPNCLLPVTTAQTCGACLTTPPAFTRALTALHYTFPVDALIQALKYQKNLTLASILSGLLIEKIEQTGELKLPDIIIPMPLHPKRLQERGFNQALEISRPISKQYKIKLLPNTCKRIRNTPSQTKLPWKARYKNIRNAFTCNMNLSGKHVAIVDDVMTTGTTLNELAKILRQQGATEVYAWVVARTLPTVSH